MSNLPGGSPGIVVIAGGGSVAYGVEPSGREAFRGGLGCLMGDAEEVYPTGGIFIAEELILTPFRRQLIDRWPCVQMRPPRYAPVFGALIRVAQKHGLATDEAFLARIEATSGRALKSNRAFPGGQRDAPVGLVDGRIAGKGRRGVMMAQSA